MPARKSCPSRCAVTKRVPLLLLLLSSSTQTFVSRSRNIHKSVRLHHQGWWPIEFDSVCVCAAECNNFFELRARKRPVVSWANRAERSKTSQRNRAKESETAGPDRGRPQIPWRLTFNYATTCRTSGECESFAARESLWPVFLSLAAAITNTKTLEQRQQQQRQVSVLVSEACVEIFIESLPLGTRAV